MASEGFTGDTIIIVDISLPFAERYEWLLPEEAAVLVDGEHYKELVFREAGIYYVELNAKLASCTAMAAATPAA